MRNIYLVQHPESTHQVDGVVGGWFDSALSPAGGKDAAGIARALREAIPSTAAPRLFSSDLRRTRQSATVIGAVLDLEPVYDPRLREKSYGVAEGRPQQWLDQRFVAPPQVGDRLNHHEGIDGAESKASLARRVYSVMDDIHASDAEHVVVVTHGMTVTFVIAWWIRMPLESTGYVSFRATPGSISVLREDDYFHNRQLAVLGGTGHLGS